MTQRVSLGPGTPERETDGFTAMAGYLETLGVPLVAGRYFTRADNSQRAVIVDDHLARQLWPASPPSAGVCSWCIRSNSRYGPTSSGWSRTSRRGARASRDRRRCG